MFAICEEKFKFQVFNTLYHSSSLVSMDIYIQFHLAQLARTCMFIYAWLQN